MSDGGILDRIAEQARHAVGEHVAGMVIAAQDNRAAEHSVLLGSLAAVVACWCAAAEPNITRARLKEALADAVADFVDQATDAQFGQIQ